MENKFKIGVFGMIFDKDQRILLCHRRDYDLWNLPGGGLEDGETPLDGIVREIKEEIGVISEVVRLAGIYFKPEQNEIVFSFVCNIAVGKTKLTDEADDIKFFKLEKIPTNTSPKQIERIKDALEHENDIVMKVQSGKSSISLLQEGKLK